MNLVSALAMLLVLGNHAVAHGQDVAATSDQCVRCTRTWARLPRFLSASWDATKLGAVPVHSAPLVLAIKRKFHPIRFTMYLFCPTILFSESQ